MSCIFNGSETTTVFEGFPDNWPNVEYSDFMSHYRPGNLLTKAIIAAKTAKSVKEFGDQFEFYILYLAPAGMVEGLNVCPSASNGCKKACLFTAGRGKMRNVSAGRINRSKYFRDEKDVFLWQLVNEIDSAIERAEKRGKRAVFRLNGTSDINWPKLLTDFFGDRFYADRPNAIFYEYTKTIGNIFWSQLNNIPVHYTFSRSESNDRIVRAAIGRGFNVAVVFENHLPETYLGIPVIDGDKHDARFLDKKGIIVGLTAKGEAKKDKSGFTVLQNISKSA